ncbi:Rib/alpha-like domain-containing protein, partial [Lactobacillus equicursoris]
MKKSKYITALSAAAISLLLFSGASQTYADTSTTDTNSSTSTTDSTSQKTQADSEVPTGQSVTTTVGTTPDAKNAIKNASDLTNVQKYTWKTTPDVTTAGTKKATVVVTYTDGSTDEVDVNVVVKTYASQNTPVAKSGWSVKVGAAVKASDGISNKSSLKNNVKSYAFKSAPSTAKPGTVKATIVVTYTDGSTDEVPVSIKVTSVVTTKTSTKKSTKKEHLTKTRKIVLDRPGKNKTIKQKAKLVRKVTTTTTTIKTYKDGKLTKTSTKSKKTYGKWSKGKWARYKVPAIKNYKRSKTTIKAKTVTSKTKNQTVKVTYKITRHKPANAPYYDPADMRAKTGQYYFKSSEKRAYPNLANYKNVWLRVSILGNRVYVMSGKKVIYTMYSSAGRFEMTNGKYQSDTPRGTFHLLSAYGGSFMSSDGVGARYYMAYHGSDYLIHSVPINNYNSGISHGG